MQHHAADQLHVEMALADGALGGLAHGGEGFRDQILKRRPILHPRAERFGACPQSLVGKRRHLRLERVDFGNYRRIFLELAVVGAAEDLAGQGAKGKHWITASYRRSMFSGDLARDARALGLDA